MFTPSIVFNVETQKTRISNIVKEPNILFSYVDIDPFYYEEADRHGYKGKAFVIGSGLSKEEVVYEVKYSIWVWNATGEGYRNLEGGVVSGWWWGTNFFRFTGISDASYDLVEDKISVWEVFIYVNNEIVGYDNCFYGKI